MTTEIMGAVIAAAIVLLLLLFWRERSHADQQSAEEFQRTLEQAGNEIIGRLGAHVSRLEKLIAEADRRAILLDRQLKHLEQLGVKGEESNLAAAKAEKPTPPQATADAEENPQSFEQVLEQTLDEPAASEPVRAPQPRAQVRTYAQPAPIPPSTAATTRTPATRHSAASTPTPSLSGLEVVVAPSVADVVDLPLAPENEESQRPWDRPRNRRQRPEVVVAPSVADVVGLPLTMNGDEDEDTWHPEEVVVAPSVADVVDLPRDGLGASAAPPEPSEPTTEEDRQRVAKIYDMLNQGRPFEEIIREVSLER